MRRLDLSYCPTEGLYPRFYFKSNPRSGPTIRAHLKSGEYYKFERHCQVVLKRNCHLKYSFSIANIIFHYSYCLCLFSNWFMQFNLLYSHPVTQLDNLTVTSNINSLVHIINFDKICSNNISNYIIS